MKKPFNRAEHCRTIAIYGGMSKSPARAEASRKNAEKARQARLAKRRLADR